MTAERIKALEDALQVFVDEVVVPNRDCSCHLGPPCNWCVEHSYMAEAVENARALLADKARRCAVCDQPPADCECHMPTIPSAPVTRAISDVPAQPVAMKVKPLDVSNILRHAFLAGFVAAREIPAHEECDGMACWLDFDPTANPAYQRIVAALDVQPLTVQDAARVLLEWWHQPEPDEGQMVIEARRVMGVMSALSEHGGDGFAAFDAALCAIAEDLA